MRKAIATLLCILTIFSISSVGISAVNEKHVPTIIIKGTENDQLYDGNGKKVFSFNVNEDEIFNMVTEATPTVLKSLVTGDYTESTKLINDMVLTSYGPLVLDGNGNPQYGTHSDFTYNPDKVEKSGFSVYDYCFSYDWRLSPLDVIDSLNDYILAVCKTEGVDKVGLIGRCYGASVVLAYLNKYGNEHIDTAVFYSGTMDGSDYIDAIFTGEISINKEALINYTKSEDFLTDDVSTKAMVNSALSVLNGLGLLGFSVDSATKTTVKLYSILAPTIMRSMIGGYPSYWTLLSNEAYEKAKLFIFAGVEDNYKGFIEKTDYYHYNIQLNYKNILDKCIGNGMKFAVVAKYGTAPTPLSKNSNKTGDNTFDTDKSSLGATCAKFGETLSKDYLEKADSKYVSLDQVIDASTCDYKDFTWFIRDVGHKNFLVDTDVLMNEVCQREKQMTVFDDENFPQFTKYDSKADKVVPLDENDIPQSKESGIKRFFKALENLMRKILNFFKNLFK